MKLDVYLLIREQDTRLLQMSVERLLLGEPIETPWKSAVLYLSGPLKYNQEFLDMTAYFELLFESGGKEVAMMSYCAVTEMVVYDSFDSISIEVSGKIRFKDLLEKDIPSQSKGGSVDDSIKKT